MAYRVLMAHRQTGAERALKIEPAPAFPARDGGRDHRAARAVRIRAGGNAARQKYGEDVAAVLFVGGHNPMFPNERDIAESIVALVVVLQIWRHVEQQLDALIGDQLQPFAVAVIDQLLTGGGGL